MGASAEADPALVASDEAPAGLHPTGFDPLRATLEHYSDAAVSAVDNRDQLDRDTLRGKPTGLWVSVKGEDDWVSWCEGEQWGLDRLVYRHQVRLRPDANILWISGLEAFDGFVAEFQVAVPRYTRSEIDWPRVAARFDGIVIAPYLWERRFESWYYGWDCASGCIWNADAIEAFGPAIAMEAAKPVRP